MSVIKNLKNPFMGSGKKPKPELQPKNIPTGTGRMKNTYTNPTPKTRRKV